GRALAVARAGRARRVEGRDQERLRQARRQPRARPRRARPGDGRVRAPDARHDDERRRLAAPARHPRPARLLVRRVGCRLPGPVATAIKAVVRGPLRDRLKSASGTPTHPLENPRTKAAWVRCGMVGAVRLNVRGRDPFGCVEPGEEYDAICTDLTRELAALRDTETGEPVVVEAVRSDEVFGERYHPNLPDVLVRYRQEFPITSVTSPRIGTVSKPARDDHFLRSGEHTTNVRLWHIGPGVEAGRTVRGGHVLDVPATVLDRLGVSAPDLDGRPLTLGDRVPA